MTFIIERVRIRASTCNKFIMDFDALDMAKERHTSQIYIIQSEQSKNRAIIIYNRRRETNRTHRKLDQCYFKLVCVVDKYVPFQSNYTR